MRTHEGFKTVPCSIEKSHIEVKGKSYQLYSLKKLSHFKIIYWSFPIIIIPLSLCLAFYSFVIIVMSQNNTGVLIYSAFLCLAIAMVPAICIFSYNMLTKFRGQWVANGTKPIYIEKTDGEHIESLLIDAKQNISKSKHQQEGKYSKRDSILTLVCFVLGFALLFLPLPGGYDVIFLILIFIGILFSFKCIRDEATWK